MTSGALCSDHVNYLILRYLQEAGHESAATAFWRDWHRTPEFRNPENYPFAPVVRRGELVNVIQDGLHHDELIARVKKNGRKFQFTSVDSREALERERERRNAAVLENGVVGSRPSSSAKRKGRMPTMRPPDEFPTPAPKRQRRSEGSEGVHLNGDVMDVDAASASAEGEEDGEAASPTVASEPEIVEVPERYDSMDVAVQTDVKTGPKTTTMYWKVDKPGAQIFHSMWNPNKDSANVNTLLTVGESLCRFYRVPDDADNARQVLSVDDPYLPPNSVVTASAWHPDGGTVAWAVDVLHELPDDQQENHQAVVSLDRDSGAYLHYLCPPLMDPGAIVLKMAYSPGGKYLLVARTNLKRSLIIVYDPLTAKVQNAEPVAWHIFEQAVLDFTWTMGHQFFIAGEANLLSWFTVSVGDPDHLSNSPKNHSIDTPNSGKTHTAETILMHGLRTLEAEVFEAEFVGPRSKWDKVRYDEPAGVCAAVSTEDRRLMMRRGGQLSQGYLSGQPTALAFNPSQLSHSRTLLAVASEEGSISFYTSNMNWASPHDINTQPILTIHLSDGPALALAWSPSGDFLAVGGTDLVQIWEREKLVHLTTYDVTVISDSLREPLLTWRPDKTAIEPRNSDHEIDRPLTEPSLSWSADGESLSFAHDKLIAIIRLRPPLSRRGEDRSDEVNGHESS